MSTYKWSIASGNQITGTTYIKDTDNKIQAVMDDLVDFVNSEGDYAGQGLTYDFVDKASSQTITGVKTFTNGLIGNVTGNLTGNSDTATKISTARTLSLTGAVSGSGTFDGSANVSISTTSNITTFVSGMIMLWSGSIASIPSGWYLCNGLNGTPNLTDRFVVGAGNNYAVSATGGNKDSVVVAHTHTASSSSYVNDPGHSHFIPTTGGLGAGSNLIIGTTESHSYYSNSSTTGISVSTNTTVDSTGTSGTNANLPPYYALAYIMKA